MHVWVMLWFVLQLALDVEGGIGKDDCLMIELAGTGQSNQPSRMWSWRGTSTTGDGSDEGSLMEVIEGPGQLVYYKPGGRSFSVLDHTTRAWRELTVKFPSDLDLSLGKMGMSRALGGLIIWGYQDQSCYRVEGLDIDKDGEVVFTDPTTARVSLVPIDITLLSPESPVMTSTSKLAKGQAILEGGGLLLSHPGANFQMVEAKNGRQGNTSRAVVKTSLRPSPPVGEVGAAVQSRALRRCRHLLSILQASPSNPSSGVHVVDTQDLHAKTLGLKRHHHDDGAQSKGEGTAAGVVVVAVDELEDGTVAMLTGEGEIRLLELDDENLARNLEDWKLMYGIDREAMRRSGIRLMDESRGEDGQSTPKTGTSRPKHGREDDKNEPHVGGNTWAGGTGGSDTAGLGGRGGPYRLDKGHQVHQVGRDQWDGIREGVVVLVFAHRCIHVVVYVWSFDICCRYQIRPRLKYHPKLRSRQGRLPKRHWRSVCLILI